MTLPTAAQVSAATGATMLRAASALPHLHAAMQRWGIDTPLRQAGFLAQIGVESQALTRTEENLNYSAGRLLAVFPRYFKTAADAASVVGNHEAIANRIYGGRLGNLPHEGHKYRGRGYLQLTGKSKYLGYQAASGVPCVAQPDLLEEMKDAAGSAAWFWASKGCNGYADKRDWRGLSVRINGGTNGLAERLTLTQKALKALAA